MKEQPLRPSQRNESQPPMRGKPSPAPHTKISRHQPSNNRRCNANSKRHHLRHRNADDMRPWHRHSCLCSYERESTISRISIGPPRVLLAPVAPALLPVLLRASISYQQNPDRPYTCHPERRPARFFFHREAMARVAVEGSLFCFRALRSTSASTTPPQHF